jgi:hypothetical protein
MRAGAAHGVRAHGAAGEACIRATGGALGTSAPTAYSNCCSSSRDRAPPAPDTCTAPHHNCRHKTPSCTRPGIEVTKYASCPARRIASTHSTVGRIAPTHARQPLPSQTADSLCRHRSYRKDGLLRPVLGDEVCCASSDRKNNNESGMQLGGCAHCCCSQSLSLQARQHTREVSMRR